ncbi:hypothetical protein [Vibrio salinus]|uniref:hypothetical protein n=1 Tax=Vibrio salinus TaxID=2899784 RepID=UPI001E53F414|nr:hypothetical protein [Vibrio salinus]MCE0494861.1 hypothetical protein [Vibrio salinus]
MQKLISAAAIMALLFLVWGIGIANVMADNASTTTRNKEKKQAQHHPVNKRSGQARNKGTIRKPSDKEKSPDWNKDFQKIEKEMKKEQAELKSLTE